MQSCKENLYSIVKMYAQELKEVTPTPEQEVEYILLDLLKFENRAELYAQPLELSLDKLNRLEEIVQRRKERIPLQYLTARVNFYGFNFYVREGIFIPRPETEVLIDYVVKRFRDQTGLRVIEIGTGVGTISICLTKLLPACKIIATDINFKALSLAKINARVNKCEQDICFLEGDLFQFLKPGPWFDLLVSNPPYLGKREFDTLQPEVKKEPWQALLGGERGWEFSLQLIEEGSKLLKENGSIVIEIDGRKKKFYQESLGSEFSLEFVQDLQGRDRVMALRLKDG